MKHFTELDAWKIGTELMQEVYRITKKLPFDEREGLAKQLRKSSRSVLANIAEGFGKHTDADKANKYTIARGECTETEAHLRMIVSLNFITNSDAEHSLNLAMKMGRLTSGMIRRYRQPASKSEPEPQPQPQPYIT